MRDLVDKMGSVAWSQHDALWEGRPTRPADGQAFPIAAGPHAPRMVYGPVGPATSDSRPAGYFRTAGKSRPGQFHPLRETWSAVVVVGDAHLVQLGIASEVDELTRRLHADLDALAPDDLPQPLVDVVRKSASRAAKQLDRELLSPIIRLTGERPLIVVPTGGLRAVYWVSLLSCAGLPSPSRPRRRPGWPRKRSPCARPRGRSCWFRSASSFGCRRIRHPLRYPS